MTLNNNGTGTWSIENVGGNGTYTSNVTINSKLEPGYFAPPPSNAPTITIGTQTMDG